MPVVPAAGNAGFRNELLRALPADELQRLRPQLMPVTLVVSQVLHEAESPIDEVFFLESGLAFLTADTKDHGLVEVGTTGRDGFVGLPVLLSPEPISVHRAFIQIPGRAYRLRAAVLREMAEALPTLRDRCLRYVQVMLMQNSQIAACNARHDLPGRLARWLLMSRDRIDGNDLPMTQEFLSTMLGVRRAGISVVANSLQGQGLIRQSRGRITILDRARLEERACTCYRMIEHNRARIMGTSSPAADAPAGLNCEPLRSS
jgi:CRP-like cAMP-binding protein